MSDPRTNSTIRAAKYQTVVDAIRHGIVTGELAPGERLPPRSELESQFDVTNMTIQRAVDQLKQEGFLHSRGRWGLYVDERPPCLHRYALVLPHVPVRGGLPWPRETSLIEAASRSDCWGDTECVIYADVAPASARTLATPSYERLLEDLAQRRLAGLIFARAIYDMQDTPLLADDGVPRVAMMSSMWKQHVSAVRTDQEGLITRALRILRDRGCRRVGLVAPTIEGSYHSEIFAQGAQKLGMTTCEAWIQGVQQSEPQWARNSVQLIASLPADSRPDGLLVTEDSLLPHVAAGLLASGIRMPDEMQLVAHANFPCHAPQLVPMERLGFDSVEVLRACLVALQDRFQSFRTVPARLQSEVVVSNAGEVQHVHA